MRQKSPRNVRLDCERAGYSAPVFHPHYILPIRWLDNMDAGIEAEGRHLGSAFAEKRCLDYLKRKGWDTGEAGIPETVEFGFEQVERYWFSSMHRTGGSLTLGKAANRAGQEASKLLRDWARWDRQETARAPETVSGWVEHWADASAAVSGDQRGRSERYRGAHPLRINDRWYGGRSAEDVAMWNMEWDHLNGALDRLPLVQREALVGLLKGRPQHETARLLGVDRSTVWRAERDVRRRILGLRWSE